MFLDASERRDASQRFDAMGVPEKGLKVGIFPGAGWRLREWMPDRFAAIGDRLVRHFNAEVLIFGGPTGGGPRAHCCEFDGYACRPVRWQSSDSGVSRLY